MKFKNLIFGIVFLLCIGMVSAANIENLEVVSSELSIIPGYNLQASYNLDTGYSMEKWFVNGEIYGEYYLPFSAESANDFLRNESYLTGTPEFTNDGFIANGLVLDESDSNLLVYNSTPLFEDNKTLTYMLWYKQNDINGYNIFGGTHALDDDGFQIFTNEGLLEAWVPCGPNSQPHVTTTYYTQPDVWYFAALVIDNGKATLYYGNETESLQSSTVNLGCTELYENGANFVTGSLWNEDLSTYYSSMRFNGVQDEIKLFNEALNSDYINSTFEQSKLQRSNDYLPYDAFSYGDDVSVCVTAYNETEIDNTECSSNVTASFPDVPDFGVSNNVWFYTSFDAFALDYISGYAPDTDLSYIDTHNNKGIVFNGEQGLVYPDDLEWYDNMSDGFSLAIKYKTTDYTGSYNWLVGRYESTDNNRQFIISEYTNGLSNYVSSDGTPFDETIFITDTRDVWNIIVMTYDGTTLTHYLNDELVNQTDFVLNNESVNNPFMIGGDASTNNFEGIVDDVVVFEGVVDAADIYEKLNENNIPGAEPETLTDLTNNIVNSQGLEIHFDIYGEYDGTTPLPVYVITDSWSSTRTSYRAEAQAWANRGYLAVNIETRGKGNSTGSYDVAAFECLDIYEVVQYVLDEYSPYIDSDRIYLNGLSGAGGKALNCPGKMPDLFTAAQGVAGTLNYTQWYNINTGFTSSISDRIGATPTEDPEAYKSRNGAWTGYNTRTPLLIHHGDADTSVHVNISRDFNTTVSAYPWTTVHYVEQPGQGHSFSSLSRNEAVTWFSTYTEPVVLPTSGDLRIGNFLRTKMFDIDLALDKVGTVEYDFSDLDSEFVMTIDTETYTGPVNITVKDVLQSGMVLIDNSVTFATIEDSVITSSNESYNVEISGDDISFTLPHMSEHEVIGDVTETTEEAESRVTTYQEGIVGVKTTAFAAFGLIAIMILGAVAMLVVSIFSKGADIGQMMTVAIWAIGAAIVLMVGFIIISAVAGGIL